jgi:pyruvate kinase
MVALDQFFNATGKRIPVVLDLQGSKWRFGSFPGFELVSGQRVRLVLSDWTDDEHCLPVPHADFFMAARESGSILVLNDGKNRLEITDIQAKGMTAEVVEGGPITSRKGITFSETAWRVETLSEKDAEIIANWSSFPQIRFAVSYIRDAEECKRYRNLLPSESVLISKLEREDSIRDAFAIADCSDEIWVCRGDLGAELGFAGMAKAVFGFDKLLPGIEIPVCMAGQVLEHLTKHRTPTRAEVCDLYSGIQRGYSGVVLSDETAIGTDPINACRYAAVFRAE